MPTYQYRCLSCKEVQLLVHSMQSFMTPACAACGGLTEKIIGQAPTVLSQRPDPAVAENESEPEHHCNSGCAMHRNPLKPAQPKAE